MYEREDYTGQIGQKNILALEFFGVISGLLSHVVKEFSKNSIAKVGGNLNQNCHFLALSRPANLNLFGPGFEITKKFVHEKIFAEFSLKFDSFRIHPFRVSSLEVTS